MGDLTRYFSAFEFNCRCGCGESKPRPSLVALLERMRHRVKRPIVITSGWRCETHNDKVGGSRRSAHLEGYGADLYAPGGLGKHELVRCALAEGALRVGIGLDFVHVDTSPILPSPRLWTYHTKKEFKNG